MVIAEAHRQIPQPDGNETPVFFPGAGQLAGINSRQAALAPRQANDGAAADRRAGLANGLARNSYGRPRMLRDQAAVRDPAQAGITDIYWTDLDCRNLAKDLRGWGFESLRARPGHLASCDLEAAVTAAESAANAAIMMP
jgi:hypothetical protein